MAGISFHILNEQLTAEGMLTKFGVRIWNLKKLLVHPGRKNADHEQAGFARMEAACHKNKQAAKIL